MSRVFVSRQLPGQAIDRLAADHDVDMWPHPHPPTPEQLLAGLHGADAAITMLTDRIDRAVLQECPNLRVIANYAVGYDNIDLTAANECQIAVGNTPDVLTDATADLTLALLLAVARNLTAAERDVRDGHWHTWEPAGYLGHQVAGATLLVIGYGRIGQAVAARAGGFGMKILSAGKHDLHNVPALLTEADYVSLHCPLTPQTRHLINAEALQSMKPTAVLINTARGPLVDTQALNRALHHGDIGGAGLDVTDPEPLPSDHPLLTAPNLLVTPHIGSATHAARWGMTDRAVANVRAGLSGHPLPYPVAPRLTSCATDVDVESATTPLPDAKKS